FGVVADRLDGVAEEPRLAEAGRGVDAVACAQLGRGASSQTEREDAFPCREVELLPGALHDRRSYAGVFDEPDLLRSGGREGAVGQLAGPERDESADADLKD